MHPSTLLALMALAKASFAQTQTSQAADKAVSSPTILTHVTNVDTLDIKSHKEQIHFSDRDVIELDRWPKLIVNYPLPQPDYPSGPSGSSPSGLSSSSSSSISTGPTGPTGLIGPSGPSGPRGDIYTQALPTGKQGGIYQTFVTTITKSTPSHTEAPTLQTSARDYA